MGFLECHGATHQGLKKELNEDNFLVADVRHSLDLWQTSLSIDDHSRMIGNSLGKLLVVADGCGSPESARRASTLTVERILEFALNELDWRPIRGNRVPRTPHREFKAAIEECQELLFHQAEVFKETLDQGMASSLTMAVICWPRLHLASVGNCRCYRLRQGMLRQLTRDDSLPTGAISVESRRGNEVLSDDGSSVLSNLVGGTDKRLVPHVVSTDLEFGDSLLLCTDGLNRHVANARIAEILEGPISAAQCCEALINDGLSGGGEDNITVVVGKFLEAPRAPAMELRTAATPEVETASELMP